jgi:hypothetical protein
MGAPGDKDYQEVLSMSKNTLTFEDIEAQTALELPDRNMLALVNVVIFNVLNGLSISIPVQNNHVGVQVCAVVDALTTILTPGETLTCTLTTG